MTDDLRHWFAQIADVGMHRSPIGELAQRCWEAIPQHMPHVDVGEFVVMPNHVHGVVVIRERLVDARGRAMDGVRDGVADVGACHDAPDTTTNAPGTTNAPEMNTTDFTGGSDVPPHESRAHHDDADAPSQHARARHDAPLRDPRKPPGIPRGALGQIVASYKSVVTRMAYRDGLLPHGTPVWQRQGPEISGPVRHS